MAHLIETALDWEADANLAIVQNELKHVTSQVYTDMNKLTEFQDKVNHLHNALEDRMTENESLLLRISQGIFHISEANVDAMRKRRKSGFFGGVLNAFSRLIQFIPEIGDIVSSIFSLGGAVGEYFMGKPGTKYNSDIFKNKMITSLAKVYSAISKTRQEESDSRTVMHAIKDQLHNALRGGLSHIQTMIHQAVPEGFLIEISSSDSSIAIRFNGQFPITNCNTIVCDKGLSRLHCIKTSSGDFVHNNEKFLSLVAIPISSYLRDNIVKHLGNTIDELQGKGSQEIKSMFSFLEDEISKDH